jgi:MFS family permease
VSAARVLAILAVAELCAMAPWFSASAVAPALAAAWHLGPIGTAGLTISVQLGFVAGALVSDILTLADIWSARRLVAGAAVVAGLATIGVALSPGPVVGFAWRFLTGAALAGVYPPGMKVAAGWFRETRGWAIGILVGALTLGSAVPHLIRWVVPADAWRTVLVVAAASALAGGALVLRVPHDGPFAAPSPRFSWSAAPQLLRDRAVLLANLGYLGHMWELYAMWTWMAAFVSASETARQGRRRRAGRRRSGDLQVVGIGAVGCWLGGKYADRWGRTLVTSAAMRYRMLLPRCWPRVWQTAVGAAAAAGHLGSCGGRGFRPVLDRRQRARADAIRRHGAHIADESRVSPDGGDDLLAPGCGGHDRVALEHERVGDRTRVGSLGDAGVAAAPGSGRLAGGYASGVIVPSAVDHSTKLINETRHARRHQPRSPSIRMLNR